MKNKRKFTYFHMVLLIIVLFTLGFIMTIVASFNLVHNEKVMFCEVANSNADVVNELIPYFERYMDDSIESVKNINSSLANLLELQLVGARDLEMPKYDCPKERCGILTSNLESRMVCDFIEELKYGSSYSDNKSQEKKQ